MKILKRIVGGFVILALGFGTVFAYAMISLSRGADAFMQALMEGEWEAAYEQTTWSFQQMMTEEDFEIFVGMYELDQIERWEWGSRSVNRDQYETVGRMIGTIWLESGTVHEVEIDLEKEEAGWRIDWIWPLQDEFFGSDVADSIVEPPTLPPEETLNQLIRSSMERYANAIETQDFTEFYGEIAQMWRDQVTIQDFNTHFAEHMGNQTLIDLINGGDIVLEESEFILEGSFYLIELIGYYTDGTQQADFNLGYLYEDPEWKLWKIYVTF